MKKITIALLCLVMVAVGGAGVYLVIEKPWETPAQDDPTTTAGTTAEAESAPTETIMEKMVDMVQFGGYDWRVLKVTDGKALLLSENVLEIRIYHDLPMNDLCITWRDCGMRQYLNGAFYDSVFTAEEKARIIETVVVNNNNEWFGTPGGENTVDKIFLLSNVEVARYFGDSGQLGNRPAWGTGWKYEIDDEYNSARIARDSAGTAASWWLRSPGSASHLATHVGPGGHVFVDGSYVGADKGGMRPALWINLVP